LYLAYLRAAFHACYYCAVVTDHLEELQRKCLQHVRKPLSKSLLEEVKAAEAEKEKKERDDEKESDAPLPPKPTENRDWKRNGKLPRFFKVSLANEVEQMSAGWSGLIAKLRC
jgi:hypothetical protein